MGFCKRSGFLTAFCLLLSSLVVASEEAPSTSSRKRRYSDSACVTPPENQRQRTIPRAPRGSRRLTLNGPQEIFDQIQENFDRHRWIEHNPRSAHRLLCDAGKFPGSFDLRSQDGRSLLFMVSQHSELWYYFGWFWAALSGDAKKKEVDFQPGLNKFGINRWNGNTLLHNLIKDKKIPMAHRVSLVPQNFLRKNTDGKFAFECYSDPQQERVGFLKAATLAQASACLKKTKMGLCSGYALR